MERADPTSPLAAAAAAAAAAAPRCHDIATQPAPGTGKQPSSDPQVNFQDLNVQLGELAELASRVQGVARERRQTEVGD
jgi:predicted Zn-dependent protease